MTIRILLADDDVVLRQSLKALFIGTEMQAVAEASTGEEAGRMVREEECDVVLLDIEMPKGDGLEALGWIKLAKPELPVLMHSALTSPRLIALSRDLGASGWVVKGAPARDLIEAIRVAVRLTDQRTDPHSTASCGT